MQSTYFISDIHLGVLPKGAILNREELLIAFLKKLENKATHLFFVGDLFEFWYEYDYYIPTLNAKIFKALHSLKEKGCKITLIRGNHDFALGNFFKHELDIEVCSNVVAELCGRRIYICHGDGLACGDGYYRFFRKVLDFKPNRFLFKWLHPDIGMRIALSVGANSRDLNKKRLIPEEDYFASIKKLMKKHSCDTFVHGHNHVGGVWKIPEGVILNCGNYIFEENFAHIQEKICYFHSSHLTVPSSAC